jgi:hypothetical protein
MNLGCCCFSFSLLLFFFQASLFLNFFPFQLGLFLFLADFLGFSLFKELLYALFLSLFFFFLFLKLAAESLSGLGAHCQHSLFIAQPPDLRGLFVVIRRFFCRCRVCSNFFLLFFLSS